MDDYPRQIRCGNITHDDVGIPNHPTRRPHKRLRRICGYLARFSNGCIRIRMEKPDYSGLPNYDQDWLRLVYGNIKETLPKNCPEPIGKSVCTSTYKDANLYHNMCTGRAVTRIPHFINKTPIDWYSRNQSTVETATYGSEFSSANTAIQQTQGLRTTLRCLGVPVDDTSYMFGDIRSVVMSERLCTNGVKKVMKGKKGCYKAFRDSQLER
jgi:hypothetical protein